MSERRTVIVTGGGTGGHVYPGLALAAELRAQDPLFDVLWVGSADRIEARAVPAAGTPIEFIDSVYFHGRTRLGRVGAVAASPRVLLQASRVVRRHRPAAVVGVGGYVSAPVSAVAAASGVPLFILEQNARAGATNRLLSRVSRLVFAAFEESRAELGGSKVRVHGNPVRGELLDVRRDRAPSAPFRLLVLGGSQGARVLNAGTPPLAAALAAAGVKVSLLHVCGAGREEEVRAAYSHHGIEAEVVPFIDAIGEAYAWADLVIARAGATTISELTAIGIPAVYVPFAAAAADHQTLNAAAVVRAGGGVSIRESEFSDDHTVDALVRLLTTPRALVEMGDAARRMGRPDAGRRIAEDIIEVLR